MSEDPARQLASRLTQAMFAVGEALRPLGPALVRGMQQFWASPDGRYLRAVVDYYDRHPDELDAMIAAREAEAAREHCHCLCAKWGHLGECTSYATAQVEIRSPRLGLMLLPVCAPCGDGIETQRAAPIGAS